MSYKSKKELIEKIEKDLEEDKKLRFKFEREITDDKIQKRKGFIRRLQLEGREAGLDGVVLKAQEVASLQKNEIEQEEKLAAELSLIRRREIRDEKLRQHLRENSHELKELEKQLKSAYVNKVLAAQIAETEARKAQEQMFEHQAREVMMSALGSHEEVEKNAILFERQMKEEYRRTLQDQIIEKERIRQEEYTTFMNEKKAFEDTVRKIKEEEAKEKAEKLLMKQKMKEEMEQFSAAKELWKARERMILEKENQKLEEEALLKEQHEMQRNEKRKSQREEAREQYVQQITKEILERNREKEERLEMIKLIKECEAEERKRMEEEEELQRNMVRRRETWQGFLKLLEEKDRKLKEEKALDASFARQMNLKVREEEARETMKNERKRQNMVEDRRYNEEKIKQNIQKHAESLKLAQMASEVEEREQKKREAMIEEERIRILKEHAPHLLGYFPKGCLKERDLEILGITGNSPLSEANMCISHK